MGAIACLAEERWDRDSGAPLGPSFDITFPSSRNGGPYRIVRDAVTGAVLHIPRCYAWHHRGPTVCRHVSEGIARAEQPASAFLEAAGAAFDASTYWASREAAGDLLATLKRALDDARRQIAENAAGAKARAASDSFRALPGEAQEAEAVEAFGYRA